MSGGGGGDEDASGRGIIGASSDAATGSPPPPPPAYKWKLDGSEDGSGRRLRLKRDYRFREYVDERREGGPPGGDATASEEEELTARTDLAKTLGGIGVKAAEEEEDADAEEGDGGTEGRGEESAEGSVADPGAAAGESSSAAGVSGELSASERREVLVSVPRALLVSAKRTVVGRLDVSRRWVHFVADSGGGDEDGDEEGRAHSNSFGGEAFSDSAFPASKKRFWRWPTARIDEVHHARYRLQHVALELFLSGNGGSAFLAFEDRRTMRHVASKICGTRGDLRAMDRRRKLDAAKIAQDRWRRRELSTFDYLAALNVLAGRTRNDLTQYPVFPWVLADYESDRVDLDDPAAFRDLSKPVGALNPRRLAEVEERYAFLERERREDPANNPPPFHYGSHYSSAGIVLFFMLRLEPFTALARQLQGGRFDHADRLFASVANAWNGCLESTADVKELIPEFYSLPEFLENRANLNLGFRSEKIAAEKDAEKDDLSSSSSKISRRAAVSDVALPPWARGSAHEFVRVMREALESEHASSRMHEWIDLIFGVAQRGPESVTKKNVFHHLTYEGAADLDAIADPARRAAAEAQIVNFGQTPAQLFKRPHPRRDPPLAPLPALRHAPGSVTLEAVVKPPERGGCPVAFIAVARERGTRRATSGTRAW